ncbi:MAG: Fatty acid desaturase; Delta-9 fatty acid desaturase, partial [uncultured Blastococcus sp.]
VRSRTDPAHGPAPHGRTERQPPRERPRWREGRAGADHALRVRDRPVPGAGRDRAGRLGLGVVVDRRLAVRGLLLPHPARGHRRLPPALHPWLVQGREAAPRRARRRRWHGGPGPGHPVGGRPPPPPRVRRPRGRPALPVAVRGRCQEPRQGDVPRPPRLAVRPPPDQRRPLRTRPGQGHRRPPHEPSVHPLGVPHLRPAHSHRRTRDRQLDGRLVGLLLGRPGARGAAAPRHLVDQLGVPRGREPAVHLPRPGDELLAAGDPQRRRVVAQPAPRRPHLRPARRAPRPDRHQRPRDLGVREARPGQQRQVAGPGAARGQAAHPRSRDGARL